MHDVLAVLTIVVAGLMVGVEFAVAVFVNPIFDRLPNNGGIAAHSEGGRILGRVMPFWYMSAVVLSAAWAAVAWGDKGASLVAAGTGLLVVSVVLSLTVLVPINEHIKTWAREGAPADWREQSHRWSRYHYLRVGIIVLAFVLFAVALV